MAIIFLGDIEHRSLQEKQVATLESRELTLACVEYWDSNDTTIFSRLETLVAEHGGALTLVASRHGSVPATHWTSRNPRWVRRLVLLHPSLHLNLPYQPLPSPHFVPTLVVCNSKEFIPSSQQLSTLSGKLFCDYSLHITPEPSELEDTLRLLSFD